MDYYGIMIQNNTDVVRADSLLIWWNNKPFDSSFVHQARRTISCV